MVGAEQMEKADSHFHYYHGNSVDNRVPEEKNKTKL